MTKFDAAYHRERKRIRQAKAKLAYDMRWSKGEEKVRKANRKARAQNVEGRLTLSDWQAILNRQSGRCATCKELATELDHIFALSYVRHAPTFYTQHMCKTWSSRKWPASRCRMTFRITIDP